MVRGCIAAAVVGKYPRCAARPFTRSLRHALARKRVVAARCAMRRGAARNGAEWHGASWIGGILTALRRWHCVRVYRAPPARADDGHFGETLDGRRALALARRRRRQRRRRRRRFTSSPRKSAPERLNRITRKPSRATHDRSRAPCGGAEQSGVDRDFSPDTRDRYYGALS